MLGNWLWMPAAGSNITVEANGINRVLKVLAGNSIEIQNLTFIGGYASNGSAIDNLGTLTLRDCILQRETGSSANTLRNTGLLNIYGNCDIGD